MVEATRPNGILIQQEFLKTNPALRQDLELTLKVSRQMVQLFPPTSELYQYNKDRQDYLEKLLEAE